MELSEKQRRLIINIYNVGCFIIGILAILFVDDIRAKFFGLYLMLHHLISDWGGELQWMLLNNNQKRK